MFMDELKAYSNSKPQLQAVTERSEDESEAIGMKLGLKKCAVAHTEKGKLVAGGNVQLVNGKSVKEVADSESYRYLGES